MALNDLQLKNLKPKSKRFVVLDSAGLYIQVYPSGVKSWLYRYNFEGRARKLNLGQYPAVPLSEARQKAAEAAQKVKKGIDPGEEKQLEKVKFKATPTFPELVDEFWSRELKDKKSGPQTHRLLNYDCVPAWKHKRVESITRRDIVILLDKIRDRSPVVANRVHGSLSRIFNFAAERGIIDDSPCTRIRKNKEKSRSRILSNHEIKELWESLEDPKQWDLSTRLALKFLLITGQRPGEVAGARWDEIQGEVWTIPAERMKNKEQHSVPLTSLAMDVLDATREYTDSEFIFPSSKGKGHVARLSLSRAIRRRLGADQSEKKGNYRRRQRLNMDPFTPHDLRRTVRSKLAELGVDDVVAERVLSHRLKGILAVYNRYDYMKEKRQALQKWERHLRFLVGLPVPEGRVIHLHAV